MSVVRRRLAALSAFDALILTSLIWFVAKFVRYAFPPLFETFQTEYGASPATLGLLFTGLMAAYGAMQFPSGALADRIGRGRIITAGVLVVSVTAIALFASRAFAVLVAAMVLIGLGTGVHKTVAIDLMATAYPERTGRALGTMDAIGELSGVAAPAAVVAVLAAPANWRVVFGAVGVVGVVLAVAFHRRVATEADARDEAEVETDGGEEADGTAGESAAEEQEGGGSYLRAFADPRFAAFVAVVVGISFVANGLTAFLPLYLTSAKGLSTGTAGLIYAALFGVGLIQPVTGALADRFGRDPVMVAALALHAVAFGALLVAATAWTLAGAVVLIGVGMHGFRPVRDAHLVALIPDAVSGGTLGGVRTVMIGVGSVAPAIVGVVSEVAGFPLAFAVLAAVTVGAAAGTVGLAVRG